MTAPSPATTNPAPPAPPRARQPLPDGWLRLAACLLWVGIFLFDLLSPLGGAVAVLYVLVLGIAACTANRRDTVIAAIACLSATLLAYVTTHLGSPDSASALRAGVSLLAISGATAMILKIRTTTAALADQAGLLDLTHDMIFVRDPQGRITYWNRAAETTYGWTAPEAQGQIADRLLQTRYPADRSDVDRTLHQTGSWEGQLTHHTRAGAVIEVHSRWAVQRDGAGRITGVLETNTDITELRAQHEALARSERRFRRMFQSSRIGVVQEDWSEVHRALRAFATETGQTRPRVAGRSDFVTRARHLTRITDVNPAFVRMIGAKSPEDYVATVDDLLSREDSSFGPALAAYASGAEYFEGETQLVHADGHEISVLFTMTFPAPEDAGEGVLIFCMDVTDQRQAQDALAGARAELAHAARVATLGELSASIAHEVNQPLMAIVTSGDAGLRWLRRPVPDLTEVGMALERVTAEGRRAGEIVQRIRSYLGDMAMKTAPVAVAPLIRDAVTLVSREMGCGGVTISLDLAEGLPPVPGDKVQLQQVLVNLFLNAAQVMAAQATPRRIHVTARTAADGEMITIRIRDTGPGIAPDQIERLFQPFFTTRPDGMGMGLAICRRTVEAHGGRICATLAPAGGGLVFHIHLPLTSTFP